jgi:peroxiredoxin
MSIDPRCPVEGKAENAAGTRLLRRLTVALALGVLGLIGGLAALPLLATQPRPAPELTFRTAGGDSTPLSSLRGRPVLVSFWSTNCGTCLTEMPSLVALHERFAPSGLRTFAVSMAQDRPEQVLALVRARGLPFEIVLDGSGAVAREFYDTQVTPTKFLIDAEGRIVRTYAGFTDFADLQRRIERALGG